MARFPDLESGFEKYLALGYGRHIVTGHLILHSLGLEGGGGTGAEVVLLVAFGDGAYNEEGEGAWGISAEFIGESEEITFINKVFNLDGFSEPVGQITPPGAIQNNDLMIVGTLTDHSSQSIPTTPTGWTKKEEQIVVYETGTAVFSWFVKKFSSSDSTPYNFLPASAPNLMDVAMMVWRGVDLVEDSSSFGIETDTPGITEIPVPSVDTSDDNHTVVAWGEWRFADANIPSGYSTVHDGGNTSVGTKIQASAGASGTINIPVGGTTTNDIGAGAVFALKPSVEGSGEISESDAVERVLYAGEDILTGYHYHPGTISKGEADPIQGIDSYFPGGLTYSATPNMAILLPGNMSEDADASKLAVIIKTSCIGDYDVNGNLISIGYSANPARVKADMLKRRGQHTRINWPSFVHARDYYDGLLDWAAGDTNNTYASFTGIPTYTKSGNITIVAGTGAASKPNAIDGNDNVATTQERILAGTDGWYKVVVSGAFPNFTGGGSIYLVDKNGKPYFGLSWGNGHFSTLANGVAIDENDQPYPFPASAPVTFEIGVDDDMFYLKQDGTIKILPQGPAPAPVDTDLFGRLHLWESTAALSSSEFSGRITIDTSLVITQVKRFEAHPAFTGPVDLGTALDYVDQLCASDTQDAGSEIIFLTPEPRTSVHIFDEDVNVVGFEVHPWQKDVRDRPNRLWAKYRNLDTEFFEQDSVFDLRDDLFNEVGRPIDPGPKNFGSMSASQAKRLIKFYMRRESDNYRFCDLIGMHDSVHVLPADVVTVLSHKYSVILSTGYTSGVTSVVLQTGEAAEFRLPPTPFFVTWWNFTDYEHPNQDPFKEIVQVTAVAGDTLTISASAANHNIAGKVYHLGRIPKDFLVLSATRQSFETSPLNRDFGLQEYYPDDYKDDDHEPNQTTIPTPPPPSVFSCPPTPVLQLSQMVTESVNKIIGTVHFGIHPHPQFVKIYVTPEGGTETFTGLTIEPASGSTTGTFEYIPGDFSTFTFRAEIASGSTVCGSATKSILVANVIVDTSESLPGTDSGSVVVNLSKGEVGAGSDFATKQGDVLASEIGAGSDSASKEESGGGFWDTSQSPTWTGITGATESPTGLLTKTETTGWGNCGAVSNETFAGDCRLSYIFREPANSNNLRMIGIGTDASCNTFSTIDNGHNLEVTAGLDPEISIYENGSVVDGDNPVGDEPADDGVVMEIERVGTTIRHYFTPFQGNPPEPGLGGRTLLFTSGVSSSGSIRVNVAIFGNGRIIDAADMDWRAI